MTELQVSTEILREHSFNVHLDGITHQEAAAIAAVKMPTRTFRGREARSPTWAAGKDPIERSARVIHAINQANPDNEPKGKEPVKLGNLEVDIAIDSEGKTNNAFEQWAASRDAKTIVITHHNRAGEEVSKSTFVGVVLSAEMLRQDATSNGPVLVRYHIQVVYGESEALQR